MLTLGEQVDGLEPNRQRQLGVLEDGPRRGAGLVTAVLALEQAPGEAAVPAGPALGAKEALAPAGLADGLTALLLGGVGRVELPQREALLKLDILAGHGVLNAHSIATQK